MITCNCTNCGVEFDKYPAHVISTNNFCSKDCFHEFQRCGVEVIHNCTNCNKEFKVQPYRSKKNKNNFCSKECVDIYKATRVECSCSNCNKKLRLRPFKIKRSKTGKFFCNKKCQTEYSSIYFNCAGCNKGCKQPRSQYIGYTTHFCSMKCYNVHQDLTNSNVKVSKLELWLEEHLPGLLTDRHILFRDRKELEGLEMDLWFPKERIGIEINGRGHYEPIYGEESFVNTQKNDATKKVLCKNKNITLHVINVSHYKFHPDTAGKYLKVIQSLI